MVLLGTSPGPIKDIKASEIPDAPHRTECSIPTTSTPILFGLDPASARAVPERPDTHWVMSGAPGNIALQGKDADWRRPHSAADVRGMTSGDWRALPKETVILRRETNPGVVPEDYEPVGEPTILTVGGRNMSENGSFRAPSGANDMKTHPFSGQCGAASQSGVSKMRFSDRLLVLGWSLSLSRRSDSVTLHDSVKAGTQDAQHGGRLGNVAEVQRKAKLTYSHLALLNDS